MTDPKPYSAHLDTDSPDGDALVGHPCPVCGGVKVKRIKWTMWGGALGPKLFNHVKCAQCKTAFNHKTGKPNTTAIITYILISVAVGLAAGITLAMSMGAALVEVF